jgi:DNA-binding NtrC family response regulator
VIDANGSAQAIDYCQSHPDPIDLVLSDMVMPGMSGPETVAHVREYRPSAKVLFMSGYSDHAVFKDRSAQAEVNFIQKPFMPQDLAMKLRQVLDSAPPAHSTTRS